MEFKKIVNLLDTTLDDKDLPSFAIKKWKNTKNILAPLGITAADAGFQKKIHGSGTTALIISNDQMNGIMKIVQALEDSNILLKGVTKTIKNETKEQKGGFLGTLGVL